MSRQRFRISKKVTNDLPVNVAEVIRGLQDRYETMKSFTYEVQPQGFSFYLDEDDRNTVIFGDTVQTVQMAGSHNVGGGGMSYEIGKRIAFPAGTVILNVYYGGVRGYLLHVISIGDQPLLQA